MRLFLAAMVSRLWLLAIPTALLLFALARWVLEAIAGDVAVARVTAFVERAMPQAGETLWWAFVNYPVVTTLGGAGIVVGIAALFSAAEVKRVSAGWSQRPKVIPVRYGKVEGKAQDGLIVTNDGEPAFSVYVKPQRIGDTDVFFFCGMNRYTKADGEIAVFPTLMPNGDPYEVVFELEDGLFQLMKRHKLRSFTTVIAYRDSEDHWYETECAFDYDVIARPGICARYVSQRPLLKRPDWTKP